MHPEQNQNGGVATAPQVDPFVPLLVSTEETLKLLGGYSRAGYHKLRNSGRFGPMAIKLGKKVFFRHQELKDWINAGCPPASKWEWNCDK